MRGRDIQRYKHNWDKAKLWLIATFPSLKLNIDRYPAIKEYLLSFDKERLEQAGKMLPDGTKSRKKTTHAWYELQDSCAYHAEFMRDKIIYPNMTSFLPFAYDQDEFYTNQKCFIITGKNNLKYLLGYFNSKISAKWIYENCPKLGNNRRELSKIFFENIPVPVAKKEQETHIASLVSSMLSSQEDLNRAETELKKSQAKEQIDKIDEQINRAFYKLYSLTTGEISLVEKSSS